MEKEQKKTKRCPKCGRELPTTMFNMKTMAKDGLQPYCKECQRQYYAKKMESENNSTSGIKSTKPQKRPLEGVLARELLAELRFRGYHGKLRFIKEIEI